MNPNSHLRISLEFVAGRCLHSRIKMRLGVYDILGNASSARVLAQVAQMRHTILEICTYYYYVPWTQAALSHSSRFFLSAPSAYRIYWAHRCTMPLVQL